VQGHPLTLDMLKRWPLVTYDSAFAGRARIDQAFAQRQIVPDIVLEAIDADVIKTYVEAGFGVGILAGIAYDPERDRELAAIRAGHLFGRNVTHLAVQKGAWLRAYTYAFIELLAPEYNRALMESLLTAGREGTSWQL